MGLSSALGLLAGLGMTVGCSGTMPEDWKTLGTNLLGGYADTINQTTSKAGASGESSPAGPGNAENWTEPGDVPNNGQGGSTGTGGRPGWGNPGAGTAGRDIPGTGIAGNPGAGAAGWGNPAGAAGWGNPAGAAGWGNPAGAAGWGNPAGAAGWGNPGAAGTPNTNPGMGTGGARNNPNTGGTPNTNPGMGTGGVRNNPNTGGTPNTGTPPPSTGTAKFVGNITTGNAYRAGFEKYWNQITPENEGKWGSVEANKGQYNWAALDAVYAAAKQHGLIFKQHTFVWGSQYPNWASNATENDVKKWMKAFCDRYPETKIIDVVNEPPPHTTPPFANAIGGGTNGSWQWIINSFKWAREACPGMILVLNDYNNCEYSDQINSFHSIAQTVKNAGAPIDALGCQAHDAYKVATSTVKAAIDKHGALLPVYITEYDIGIADDNQQKQKMEEQFTMFYTHAKVRGITYWGEVNGKTWRSNTGLMNGSTPRPALTWLMQYLGR